MKKRTCYLSSKLTYLKTKLTSFVLQCIEVSWLLQKPRHYIEHCLNLKVREQQATFAKPIRNNEHAPLTNFSWRFWERPPSFPGYIGF